MTKEERAQTMKLLMTMLKIFPESKLDTDGLALYVIALDDMSYDEVKAGVNMLLQTKKDFYPKPAEIREAAEKVVQHVTNSDKPTPGEAWKDALRYAHARGPYDARPYKFISDEVKQAVERFGRTSLWTMETKDEGTHRAQFMKIYGQILDAERETRVINKTLKKLGGDVAALIDNTVKQIGEGKAK